MVTQARPAGFGDARGRSGCRPLSEAGGWREGQRRTRTIVSQMRRHHRLGSILRRHKASTADESFTSCTTKPSTTTLLTFSFTCRGIVSGSCAYDYSPDSAYFYPNFVECAV